MGDLLQDFVRWLNQPLPGWPHTATAGDVLWLVLSLGFGLVFTAWNLLDAYRTDQARRRDEPQDRALCELARGHIQKAWLFALIDGTCVLIGLWAVFNWAGLPGVVLLGLLAIRFLLSAVAWRDLRLRHRLFALKDVGP